MSKCPEGFAFYPIPGPAFRATPVPRKTPLLHLGRPAHIPGLGANVPIAVVSPVDRSSIFPKSTPSRRLD